MIDIILISKLVAAFVMFMGGLAMVYKGLEGGSAWVVGGILLYVLI